MNFKILESQKNHIQVDKYLCLSLIYIGTLKAECNVISAKVLDCFLMICLKFFIFAMALDDWTFVFLSLCSSQCRGKLIPQ